MQPDEELIRNWQAGETPALALLLERYDQKISRMILYILPDRDKLNDIRQDVFLELQTALTHFRFESAFSTWLFGLVRNITHKSLHNHRRFFRVHQSAGDSDWAPPEDTNPDLKEDLKILNESLRKLKPFYRDPIVMTQLEGFSYHDTALILEINEGTLKSRINKARQLLLKEMNRRQGK
jgi:RNA polymerase sigma-70 factor (ECF subfamily)